MTSENPENLISPPQAATNAGGEAANHSGERKPDVPPIAASSDPKANPSPHKCEITCNAKRDWVDKTTIGFEVFGLIVLIVYTVATIIYACITNQMWKEMQGQTRIQRNAAINSERAWVGLGVPITLDAIQIQASKIRIKGHYSIQNFGHGPALKVIQVGSFATPNQTMEVQGREAKFFCDSSVAFATGTVPVGGDLKQPPPFGHTLFPNQGDNVPIDYSGFKETAAHLRFIGCVAYIDQFKTVHWTRFCMERSPGDPAPVPILTFCAMYNDTDEPSDR